MLETSKDLLYIIIAFCVLWLTIFLCWLLYYFISIIKNAHDIVKAIKEKIALIDELIKNIKDKVDHSATYIGLAANGVMKVVEYIKDKKTTQSSGKRGRPRKKQEPEEEE